MGAFYLGAVISIIMPMWGTQGKLIAFLDSDDAWNPEKIKKQIEYNGYSFTFMDYRTCLDSECLPYINIDPDALIKEGCMTTVISVRLC